MAYKSNVIEAFDADIKNYALASEWLSPISLLQESEPSPYPLEALPVA